MLNVTGLLLELAAAVATRPAIVRAPTLIAPARNASRRVIRLRAIPCYLLLLVPMVWIAWRAVKKHRVLDIPPQLNERVLAHLVTESARRVDDERRVDRRALDARPGDTSEERDLDHGADQVRITLGSRAEPDAFGAHHQRARAGTWRRGSRQRDPVARGHDCAVDELDIGEVRLADEGGDEP